jgi:hypothetical protein
MAVEKSQRNLVMFSNSLNDAHSQLERAILQQLQAERIDEKVIEMVQDAFSRALKGKKIVVSRAEQKRLQQEVLADILNEALKKAMR